MQCAPFFHKSGIGVWNCFLVNYHIVVSIDLKLVDCLVDPIFLVGCFGMGMGTEVGCIEGGVSSWCFGKGSTIDSFEIEKDFWFSLVLQMSSILDIVERRDDMLLF